MLELIMLDAKALRYKPSVQACAAIYIAYKLQREGDSWPAKMAKETNLSKEEIKPCAFDMCNLLHRIEKSNVKTVFKKF